VHAFDDALDGAAVEVHVEQRQRDADAQSWSAEVLAVFDFADVVDHAVARGEEDAADADHRDLDETLAGEGQATAPRKPELERASDPRFGAGVMRQVSIPPDRLGQPEQQAEEDRECGVRGRGSKERTVDEVVRDRVRVPPQAEPDEASVSCRIAERGTVRGGGVVQDLGHARDGRLFG